MGTKNTSVQPRVPAGVPVGGQFAHKRRNEADTGLATTPQERWHELLDSRDRAVLTSNGVGASWVDVAEQLHDQTGEVDYRLIVDAHLLNLTEQEASEFLRLTGGEGPFTSRTVSGFSSEKAQRVPDNMVPIEAAAVPELMAHGIDMDKLSEAWDHVHTQQTPGVRHIKMVQDVVAAGIGPQAAEATGSGDDWWRAKQWRASGVPDDEARRWAPSYPMEAETLASAGWAPEDLTPEERQISFHWATNNVDKDTQRRWAAEGFEKHREASAYIQADVGPDEAARWDDLIGQHPSAVPTYLRSGVSVERFESATQAGLVVGPSATAAVRVTQRLTDTEISEWAGHFGGTVPAETIASWKRAGVDDPSRAAAWEKVTDRYQHFTPGAVSFMDRHIDPHEVAPHSPHPLVSATAQELGLSVEVAESRARSVSQDPVTGCRELFLIHGTDPPF